MAGCLQTRNGKFYLVLDYYENGKRKRKWIPTNLPVKGNKRKAEQLLAEAQREYELKAGNAPADVRLSDYIRYWLTVVQRRVDEVTYQGYEILANGHILPYFDRTGLLLRDTTTVSLQAYIDEKALHGRKDGSGGLNANSLRLHKNILYQTLEEAVKAAIIPANPCRYLALPKAERFQSKYYTAPQLQQLFDTIRDDPLYPLIKVTALYGLRRSEVLGLKWDSINFDAGTVTIKHTVSKVTKTVEKDKTKTNSSHRTFPLTPETKSIFLSLKAEEKSNRKVFGQEYQENEYVFKWSDGHTYSPDYISHRFAALLKQHHLPHIRFHELRHSCGSLLINKGYTLKDVQEWLGHSDIKMTANIYSHLDVSRKQGMADLLTCQLS